MIINFTKAENSNVNIPVSGITNTFLTGPAGSGKTTAAINIVAELSKAKRENSGKRLRIVCMTQKSDWRTLSTLVEPERLKLLVLGDPESEPIHFNPCKIPYGILPGEWSDILADLFCRAYGLLASAKKIVVDVINELYENAEVFEAAEKLENWKEIVPELSQKVTFSKIYKNIESRVNALTDQEKVQKDMFARILDRLSSFGRENSVESRIFGNEDGIGVGDLIGNDNITVIESFGLEPSFSNFMFGLITLGFYRFGKAHEDGYKAPDQYETLLVIDEADKVLADDPFSLSGPSEFDEILEHSADNGLFVIAVANNNARSNSLRCHF